MQLRSHLLLDQGFLANNLIAENINILAANYPKETRTNYQTLEYYRRGKKCSWHANRGGQRNKTLGNALTVSQT